MNKEKAEAFFVICLSLTVVLGGWFLTKELLNRKESEILAVEGQLVMEASGSSASEQFEGEAVTEEIMAEILNIWENAGYAEFHEPLEGQMDMEQAVEAGKEWIRTLAEARILPAELSEGSFEGIQAVLCTPKVQPTIDKKLISYWTVIYSRDDTEITLKIHALSGQVWDAGISIQEDRMPSADDTDEEILTAAFPFLTGEKTQITADSGKIFGISGYGRIGVLLKRDSLLVDSQEPVIRLRISLKRNIE